MREHMRGPGRFEWQDKEEEGVGCGGGGLSSLWRWGADRAESCPGVALIDAGVGWLVRHEPTSGHRNCARVPRPGEADAAHLSDRVRREEDPTAEDRAVPRERAPFDHDDAVAHARDTAAAGPSEARSGYESTSQKTPDPYSAALSRMMFPAMRGPA